MCIYCTTNTCQSFSFDSTLYITQASEFDDPDKIKYYKLNQSKEACIPAFRK